ncbi:uncharacterized protein ARMOST_15749 [Armillaria ostoyae]|uniref:Uncharacterized protein n=1 Tax=Armillaria ostoyae TaxID=47428 RepID=A0A284RU81_ARMOS|nr:uncharacterized protein ARMOST_15749 [Armillaria ostoyae]
MVRVLNQHNWPVQVPIVPQMPRIRSTDLPHEFIDQLGPCLLKAACISRPWDLSPCLIFLPIRSVVLDEIAFSDLAQSSFMDDPNLFTITPRAKAIRSIVVNATTYWYQSPAIISFVYASSRDQIRSLICLGAMEAEHFKIITSSPPLQRLLVFHRHPFVPYHSASFYGIPQWGNALVAKWETFVEILPSAICYRTGQIANVPALATASSRSKDRDYRSTWFRCRDHRGSAAEVFCPLLLSSGLFIGADRREMPCAKTARSFELISEAAVPAGSSVTKMGFFMADATDARTPWPQNSASGGLHEDPYCSRRSFFILRQSVAHKLSDIIMEQLCTAVGGMSMPELAFHGQWYSDGWPGRNVEHNMVEEICTSHYFLALRTLVMGAAWALPVGHFIRFIFLYCPNA